MHPRSLFLLFVLISLGFFTLPASSQERIRIAYVSPSATFAIPWIGKETGIFQKHGFDAEVVLITGSPRVIQTLVSGDVHYGLAGVTAAIRSRIGGAETVILATLTNVSGMKLMVSPKAGVKRLEDLKGKVIGVSQYGSEADVVARIALSKAGLAPGKDVTILQLGGHPQAAQALMAGRIDAAVLSAQAPVVAEKFGAFILTSAQELDVLAPSGTLSTTRRYIRQNHDSVTRFMRAYVEAIHYFRTNRERSIGTMVKYMRGFPSDIIATLYNEQIELSGPLPVPTREALQAVLDREADPKAKNFRPEDFLDLSFLHEIERSGFVKALYGK